MVVPVVDETAVHLVEGVLVAALGGADLSRLEVAGVSPCLVPGGLPEEFVGLRGLALIFQREGEVVDGLTVVGVGVALLREPDSLAQILLSLVEAPLADIPQAHGVQAADVVRVAAQRLFVVVGGLPGGMTVLLEMHARQVELLVGLDLLRQQGGLGRVGDRTDLVGLGMPMQDGALAVDEGLHHLKGQFVEFRALHVDRLHQHLFGADGHLLFIIHLTVVVAQDDADLLLRGGKELEGDPWLPSLGEGLGVGIEHQILRSLLHYPELTIRHKVLGEHLFLVWHQPCEVGLVLGIDTCHEFDVGAETLTVDAPTLHLLGSGLIGQVAVPGAAEVAVSPGPLLLAGREVVAGHMQHAAAGVVLVATLEVKA